MIATRTTIGTKYPATLSAKPWIGALDLCADATMSTILANIVPRPTRSAFMMSEPVPFKVPPVNLSLTDFSTAIDSPDIILSSIEDLPSNTTPSTGTLSPGRTRNRSPTRMFSIGTSRSEPSALILLAIWGAKSRSARIAEPVRCRARSSKTCPRNTRVTITAAAVVTGTEIASVTGTVTGSVTATATVAVAVAVAVAVVAAVAVAVTVAVTVTVTVTVTLTLIVAV